MPRNNTIVTLFFTKKWQKTRHEKEALKNVQAEAVFIYNSSLSLYKTSVVLQDFPPKNKT